MFAAHHKLNNLIGITDCNRLQIDDYTKNIMDMEPLADKWRAFGWRSSKQTAMISTNSTAPFARRWKRKTNPP
jgi:transketolase N-terminal domain/subunit